MQGEEPLIYYVPVIDVYVKQLSQLLKVRDETQSISLTSKGRETTTYAKPQKATWEGLAGTWALTLQPKVARNSKFMLLLMLTSNVSNPPASAGIVSVGHHAQLPSSNHANINNEAPQRRQAPDANSDSFRTTLICHADSGRSRVPLLSFKDALPLGCV